MDINSDFDIILLASYYFHIILWVIKFRETSYVLFQGSVRLMLPESDFFDMTFNAPKPKIVGQLTVRNKEDFPIKELAGNGFNKNVDRLPPDDFVLTEVLVINYNSYKVYYSDVLHSLQNHYSNPLLCLYLDCHVFQSCYFFRIIYLLTN